MFNPRTKFINAVGRSGITFDDLACISKIEIIALYKFAGGDDNMSEVLMERMAKVLGNNDDDLFRGVDGD